MNFLSLFDWHLVVEIAQDFTNGIQHSEFYHGLLKLNIVLEELGQVWSIGLNERIIKLLGLVDSI